HAAGPRPGVELSFFHDAWVDARHFLSDVFELDVGAERLFHFENASDAGVVEHAFGITYRAHDEPRIELTCGNERLLHAFVDGRFLRCHEARAHVHALGA